MRPQSPLPSQSDPLRSAQGMLMRAMLEESTDSIIIEQERAGADELHQMQMLPMDGTIRMGFGSGVRGYTEAELRAAWERWGFEFGEPVDDLFVSVRLPEGWSKHAGENANYWTNIVDEHGRVRASMFYKAAFYDRSAHISACRRYSAMYVPAPSLDQPADWEVAYKYRASPAGDVPVRWYACFDRAQFSPVSEYGLPIYVAGSCPDPSAFVRDAERYAKCDKLEGACRAWLDLEYPRNQDPFAYWDNDDTVPTSN